MSIRRGFLQIVLPLLSALFAVGLVELILILFYPIPYSLERNMYFEADPYLGYRNMPLASGYYPNGIPAQANSLGFRDAEATLEKSPGTYRILMVGDSFTVGANVEQDDAYPQVLERLLNSSDSRNIEVLNSGVGGYEPFHYAAFVENYAADYNPDMLLLGFFVGNDTYNTITSVEQSRTAVLGRRISRNAGKGWPVLVKIWGYENLNVVRGLINKGPASLVFERERCDEFSRLFLAIQGKRIKNHLAEPDAGQREAMKSNLEQIMRIQTFARERNIPFFIALLPDENQLSAALQNVLIPAEELGKYDFEMPQRTLRSHFDSMGIPYLDLLPDFRADTRCLYMNDTHWVAAGHKMAAERIAAALAENGLPPQP
jgi:lysophospholipase L1-like esterase